MSTNDSVDEVTKIFEELESIKKMIKESSCKCKEECCDKEACCDDKCDKEAEAEEEDYEDYEDEEDYEDYEEDEEDYKEGPKYMTSSVPCCPYSTNGTGNCPYLYKMYNEQRETSDDIYTMISEYLLYFVLFLCLYSIFKNIFRLLRE
jgi:hypothetical protein